MTLSTWACYNQCGIMRLDLLNVGMEICVCLIGRFILLFSLEFVWPLWSGCAGTTSRLQTCTCFLSLAEWMSDARERFSSKITGISQIQDTHVRFWWQVGNNKHLHMLVQVYSKFFHTWMCQLNFRPGAGCFVWPKSRACPDVSRFQPPCPARGAQSKWSLG